MRQRKTTFPKNAFVHSILVRMISRNEAQRLGWRVRYCGIGTLLVRSEVSRSNRTFLIFRGVTASEMSRSCYLIFRRRV